MKFSEFISTVDVSEFNNWFDNKQEQDLIFRKSEVWKYNIKKDNKIFPFKVALKTYLKDKNLGELTDFNSSYDNRHRFCEKFGFKIHEDLIYDNKEFEAFKKFYEKEIYNNLLFQSFIEHCYNILQYCQAEPYNIRTAISLSDRDAMILMGQRPVAIFSRKGKNNVFLLLDKSFDLSKIPHNVRYEFQGSDNKQLVEILYDNWEQFPDELLQHNLDESLIQYNQIKDKKISQWNKDATTTNSVLKYLCFENINVQKFLASENNLPDKNFDGYQLFDDFENWYVGKYRRNFGDSILGNVFGFLFQVASPKYLNLLKEEDYQNYSSTTLSILKSEIPNFEYKELKYLEEFIDEKLTLKKMKSPLNQILYGPPGTGKTYNTINKAISIANPDFDLEQKRKNIKEEYHRLVETGQIVFTTFHQSMSYEDFIEGIKPHKTDENEVYYDVDKGLFRNICEKAGEKKVKSNNFSDVYSKLL